MVAIAARAARARCPCAPIQKRKPRRRALNTSAGPLSGCRPSGKGRLTVAQCRAPSSGLSKFQSRCVNWVTINIGLQHAQCCLHVAARRTRIAKKGIPAQAIVSVRNWVGRGPGHFLGLPPWMVIGTVPVPPKYGGRYVSIGAKACQSTNSIRPDFKLIAVAARAR